MAITMELYGHLVNLWEGANTYEIYLRCAKLMITDTLYDLGDKFIYKLPRGTSIGSVATCYFTNKYTTSVCDRHM